MLKRLNVKNYAIIEEIEVALAPGFNVLTGETGAGKSIIVGALGLLLGDRVSDDIVRKGADSCQVEAVFAVNDGKLRRYLEEHGFIGADSVDLRISRVVAKGARSRCRVGEGVATLAQLRQLGNLLVDFHGQHEHQLLLNARSHIDFLDGFGHLCDLRERVVQKRSELLDASRRIAEMEQEVASIRQQEDFIRHELQEIERLDLKQDEDIAIEREINLLEHAEKIIEAGSEAMDAIYDGDEAALEHIARARLVLRKVASYVDEFGDLAESLDQAEVIVKEVAENLRDHLAGIELDASRLDTLRDRRAVIERIKRKYGSSLSDVLDHFERLRTGLENTEELEHEIKELRSRWDALASELAGLARDLSAKRKVAAARLRKLIEAELRSLGIEGGGFKVVFEDIEDGEEIKAADGGNLRVGDNGAENAEFFLRTNKGEDLMPLRRIASGGEISRVMLALKTVLADVDEIGTMVFDEIDSGIGGSVADVVASKLREVAGRRQVICITHLAQIAASADLHLAVDKVTAKGRSVTAVTRLEEDGRVRELARMIGGREPPASARIHAEEILRRAVAR